MNINTETITTMTEANQNFSKVAKVAENNGQAVIFKNNKPKFLLIDVDSDSYFDITDDEKIDVAAKRIMNRFKPAFEELAK
jgi:antitoxin Phd